MVHVRRGRDFARRGAIEPLLRKDGKRRAENQLTRLVVRAGGGANGRCHDALPRVLLLDRAELRIAGLRGGHL